MIRIFNRNKECTFLGAQVKIRTMSEQLSLARKIWLSDFCEMADGSL